MSTSRLKKHFGYSGDSVKAIVAPMKTHYQLESFVYAKKFFDGSEVRLGTHPDWFTTYFNYE